MLSVLATLCVGCQTDLIFSGALASYTSHDAERVQTLVPFQPVLIAGPYDLNPGLYRPTQPERLKPHAEGRQQLPPSPPALPTVTPTSPPVQGPKGGVASPPLGQESYPVKQESPSQPASFPAPPTSPLLFISPAARPSGPAPQPLGSAPQPSDSAPRPSGPAPQPSDSAPQPSDSAPRPSGPAPQPSDSAPQPSDSAPRPSGPAPQPSGPAPQPSDSAPRPSGPAPQPSDSAPRPSGLAPRPSDSAPQPSDSAPRPSGPAPQSSGPVPQPSDSAPRPSGPAPRPSDSAPQPSDSAPRPSGPAPRPSDSAPQPSDSAPQSSGPVPQPSDSAPRPSGPAPQPAGPVPQPSDSAPRPSGPAPQPSDSAPRPSGPAPQPSDSAPQPSDSAPRPSGPAPQSSDSAPRPSDSPQQRPEVNQGGVATPIKRTSTYSPAVRSSGPRLLLPRVPKAPKSPNWTKSHQRSSSPTSSSVEQVVPRLRSLPAPPYPQNIAPTSQPGLVKSNPPSTPTPTQPLVTPADSSTQKPKSGLPKPLPTDIAPLGAIDDPKRSFIVLESFTTDFTLDFDEFGKENLEIGEIVSFRIRNGDQVTFTTGLNTYRQDNIESVKNIPLILGWETQAGDVTVNVAAGAEVFNRLDPQPTFKVGAKTSLFGEVLVSGEVEHGPYKFNATTLENEISYWRIRPGVFWQIDSKTSFLGLFQAGFFNDGNQEIQSFSRLERKIGPFSVAANVFTWNVAEDLEAQSGYFSPLSFLNYNAEIGWKGKIFDPLSCQFAASIGKQVLNGGKSTGRGLQAKCTASLADNIDLDFGYALTNILSSGSGASNSHIFTGQFQIDF